MTLTQVRTVSFDAFGTLVRFDRSRRPFAQLLACLRSEGLVLPGDVRDRVMCHPWDLRTCAQALGASGAQMRAVPWARLDEDLRLEQEGLVAFGDSLEVLGTLRARGYRLAIASNLALPYVAMVRAVLPGITFDVERWSCLVGAVKPDPRLLQNLGRPEDPASTVVHVGDTWADDVAGARAVGAQPVFLTRADGSERPATMAGTTVLTINTLRTLLDHLPARV